MIKSSKAIVSNRCEVTFDFTPQDVKYSRSNYTATHKGGGTTSRQGIWEGIECVSAQIKIGNEAWKTYTLPANKKVVVTVSSNNVTVQAKGKYRLKTMGYYFKDTTGKMPFFWYGNIGGVAYKYQKGSFRDSMSNKPDSNFYSINACVPADWTYIKAEWSDWAYKHAGTTSDWQVNNGRYAQRNGNTTSASYSNGWISDSGHKQIYRKSSLFWFEKDYTASITTSGIAVNPNPPTIKVIPAKGDTGSVELYYNSNNSGNGKITVEAKCNNKIVTIMDYNNSPDFGEQWKKTLIPDFNSIFGESYRANDVYYRAKAKNVHGYESSWTAWTGIHRYNGRPTVPQYPAVDGKNDLLYDVITFSWQASTDPDGDSLYYQLYLTAKNANGSILKNDFISRKTYGTTFDYDISSFPDNTSFVFTVKASDSLITSDWSREVLFQKGAKPTSAIALISPVLADTDIYSRRPRFAFGGYDNESTCVVELNGTRYDSVNNSNMFTRSSTKFMFKPDFDLKDGKVAIKAYLKNAYGESKHTQIYNFTKKTASENIVEGEIIKAMPVKEVQSIVKNLCKAFKIDTGIVDVDKNNYYSAKTYNDCFNSVKQVNDYINNLIPNNVFDYTLTTREVVPGEVNDDLVWEQLVLDIINM